MKKHLKKLCICLAVIGTAYAAYFTMSQPAYAVTVTDDITASLAFIETGEVDDVDMTVGEAMPWCGKNSKGCKEQPTTNHQSNACVETKGSGCWDKGETKRGVVCQCCGTLKVIRDGREWIINCSRMDKE